VGRKLSGGRINNLIDNHGYRSIPMSMQNRYQVKTVGATSVVYDIISESWKAVFSSQVWGEEMVKAAESYAADLNAARLTSKKEVA
jgi:hypothetical protein